MNKVKMFFIASALVLTTAGVFAGKAKFISNGLVVYEGTLGYIQVNTVNSVPSGFSTITNGSQVTVSNSAAHAYALYLYNGTQYQAIYEAGTGTW